MNSKHAFLVLSTFTLVSIAHGEREVFAPSKLAPVAEAGTIRFGDGSAAAPSMTFKSDTDTGVFRATDNTLGVTTGGTERMRIDSAGNVGIGTNNPGYALTIGAKSGGTHNFIVSPGGAGGNNTFIGNHGADGNLAFIYGTAKEALRINTSGEIIAGNGDTSATPAASTIRGTNASGTDVAAANLTIQAGRGTGTGAGGSLVFQTSAAGTTGSSLNAATERMRVDSSGNVGIGTNTNLSTLTINGPIAPKGPTDVNAATYTVQTTDSSLRFTTTNCTVTLPAAASFPGRILWLNTVTANSVTSNASNVIPLGSNTAGTAIFAATAGKFAMIQSNGTNWVTMMSN